MKAITGRSRSRLQWARINSWVQMLSFWVLKLNPLSFTTFQYFEGMSETCQHLSEVHLSAGWNWKGLGIFLECHIFDKQTFFTGQLNTTPCYTSIPHSYVSDRIFEGFCFVQNLKSFNGNSWRRGQYCLALNISRWWSILWDLLWFCNVRY